MSLLERVFYLHQQILEQRSPNARTIADYFEVSLATARRDIAYLKDRLLAPIVFDPKHNGYYYQEEGFSLPFEESPRIVFLLTMLNKLAEEAGLGALKEVKQLETKLSKMISADYEEIVKSLYCEWIEVESIDHLIFETIIEAIARKKTINIEYRSPKGETSVREIASLQIINYQGRWYLRAFCTLRQDSRMFHIARIHKATLSKNDIPIGINSSKMSLDTSFGIFKGEPRYYAEILFTSTAAELVRNQHWHKDQVMKIVDQGVQLQLPVNDDREIVMKILQYGGMAKVLSPPELIECVQKEIHAMAASYAEPAQENPNPQ